MFFSSAPTLVPSGGLHFRVVQTFLKEDGGIYFDRADVADSLDAMKGYTLYFQNYLATLPSDVQQYASQMLADLQDWYIAGGNGMSTTAWDGAAFMLGAGGIDNLTGGSGNDLLIGLDNNDKLVCGKGDDVLIGVAPLEMRVPCHRGLQKGSVSPCSHLD